MTLFKNSWGEIDDYIINKSYELTFLSGDINEEFRSKLNKFLIDDETIRQHIQDAVNNRIEKDDPLNDMIFENNFIGNYTYDLNLEADIYHINEDYYNEVQEDTDSSGTSVDIEEDDNENEIEIENELNNNNSLKMNNKTFIQYNINNYFK